MSTLPTYPKSLDILELMFALEFLILTGIWLHVFLSPSFYAWRKSPRVLLKTQSRHLPDTFQSPSIHLSDTCQSWSRHHPDTLQTPPGTYCPSCFSQILSNPLLGGCGWLGGVQVHNHGISWPNLQEFKFNSMLGPCKEICLPLVTTRKRRTRIRKPRGLQFGA